MEQKISRTLDRLGGGTVKLTLTPEGVEAKWWRNLGGLPSSERSGFALTFERMLELIVEHENLVDQPRLEPHEGRSLLEYRPNWN